jgi:MFS family permease
MSSPLAPTLAVLSRRPAVRLLGSSLLGRLPTGMAALAVLLLVRGRGGDYALAGLLSGLYAAGSAVGGPLLGRVIDRSRQPPVLLVAALAVVPVDGALAIVAILLAGAATPPLESCLRVLWPRVVPAERLHAAYSLDAAAQEILFVLGPLLVLAAVRLVGPAGGVLVAAGLGVLGVAAFASAPQSRTWRGERTEARHPAGPLRSGRLVRLLVSLLLTGFTIGTFSVGATAYAEHVGGRSLAGWFIAANGLGALLGGVGYTLVPAARDLSGRLRVVAVLLAVGYLPLAAQPGLAGTIGLSVLAGLSLPAVLTCAFALVERLAPAGTVTEAFTWLVTAFGIGNAVGAALSGTLVDRYGPVAAFLAGAATAILAALTVLRRLLPAPARG